jgi:hypothetical protein
LIRPCDGVGLEAVGVPFGRVPACESKSLGLSTPLLAGLTAPEQHTAIVQAHRYRPLVVAVGAPGLAILRHASRVSDQAGQRTLVGRSAHRHPARFMITCTDSERRRQRRRSRSTSGADTHEQLSTRRQQRGAETREHSHTGYGRAPAHRSLPVTRARRMGMSKAGSLFCPTDPGRTTGCARTQASRGGEARTARHRACG